MVENIYSNMLFMQNHLNSWKKNQKKLKFFLKFSKNFMPIRKSIQIAIFWSFCFTESKNDYFFKTQVCSAYKYSHLESSSCIPHLVYFIVVNNIYCLYALIDWFVIHEYQKPSLAKICANYMKTVSDGHAAQWAGMGSLYRNLTGD